MPEIKPYDISQDWGPNVSHGPFWKGELPTLPERQPDRYKFLGFPLNSLFGLAAFPLTANSSYIQQASRLGYDLLTYKSVRSIPWNGNAFPHWKYVDVANGTDLRVSEQALIASENPFPNQDVSMANSFGVHSLQPPEWQADYDKAHDLLLPGQLLILSVMPSHIQGKTLIEEGRDLARLASETKAEAFEINFACPNTDGGKGLIYEDIDLTKKILTAAKEILGTKPILAKIGYYKDPNNLETFMKETKDVVSGISSMNTYAIGIIDQKGSETFPGRPTAGISGAAIRSMAMDQAKRIVELKQELGFEDLALIGIGGVTKPKHITDYLMLGVDAVQTAVGAYEDPLLASKYLKTLS